MLPDDDFKFCTRCGHALGTREIGGRLRPACPACGLVVFFDPKVAAVVLLEQDGKILMVRRVMNPQRGKWTIPGGFVDAGEDPKLAAEREALEETGLAVEVTGQPDVLYSNEHARGASIILVYRARILAGELRAGDDADRLAFFGPDELPELAFEATRTVVEQWRAQVNRNA